MSCDIGKGINNSITAGKEMKERILDNSKGFTLIETLIAMVVSSFILGALLIATMAGQQAASGIEQKVSVQQDVRAALDLMATEISMASLSPGFDHSLIAWRGADCVSTGVAANRGIQQATSSNLTVEMDLNGNGTVTDANEIITYSYADNQITRNTCGGPQPFIGDTNVQVINDGATPPVFQYFDGNNKATVNIPDIRRITITLVVRSVASDLKGERKTAVYSTSVIPRNHLISVE
jgi:prepilin-type N-terminal cleavage/methylation domain-containing protein